MASGKHLSGLNPYLQLKSNQTSLCPVSQRHTSGWCTVIYFEQSLQVGEIRNVSSPSITIDGFTDPCDSSRLCLGPLINLHRTQSVEMARKSIGKGVKLTYDGQDVYAECLSDSAIFVQCHLMNLKYCLNPNMVIKIPPRGRLRIFGNREFAALLANSSNQAFESVYRLTKLCNICLSFVESWGTDDSKRPITSTPCWIEIKLKLPLQWLDKILAQKGQPCTRCPSR